MSPGKAEREINESRWVETREIKTGVFGKITLLEFVSCLPTYVMKSWESPLADWFLS